MKQKFEKSGFTILELVVVMSITAIIATISLANFREGEKRKRVALASDTVITALGLAQSYALSGKAINPNDANPACRIPSYFYVTFQYSVSSSVSLWGSNVPCGKLYLIETYPFPANTRIQSSGLKIDGTPAGSTMVLTFDPPYGVIKGNRDNGAYSTFNTATITVESSDGAINKTVSVDGLAGRIGP